jgi:hypothetical protein
MRYLVLALPLALLAGCVVRTGPYGVYRPYGSTPAPAPRAEVYYYGNHFIPESDGGGWCYVDGPHTHDYYPDRDDYYDYDQGYYWYRGPFLFAFFGGHPLPGGGWCFIHSGHQHDYFPPSGGDWRWNRTGYVYQGHFRPNRPPPASYWPRATPRPDWRSNRPAVRPAPGPVQRPSRGDMRPGAPDRRFEPNTRPEFRERPGQSEFAPGQERRDDDAHGRGRPDFTPPGQERRDDDAHGRGRPDFTPPGQERRDDVSPGRARPDFTPPGQEDRGGGRPTFAPPAQEERGGGRDDGRGRFERPAATPPPAPSAAPAPAPAPSRGKPEKVEKQEKQDDTEKENGQRQRPGRGR